MISLNECDARFARHQERIAWVERYGRLAVSPELGRRRRGILATTVAILAWAPSRVGTVRIVVGQWFGSKRVAEAR